MKQLLTTRDITIPEGVTVEVKARKVRVKGPRGECLERGAKHGARHAAGAGLRGAASRAAAIGCLDAAVQAARMAASGRPGAWLQEMGGLEQAIDS